MYTRPTLDAYVDPASDVRIKHPRQIVECLVAAALKSPSSHRFTNCLECLWTGCRKERSSVAVVWPLRFSGAKAIPQEVELLDCVASCAIGVLAVGHFRLLRMEFQAAFQNLRSNTSRNRIASCSLRHWQMMSSAYLSNGTPGNPRFSYTSKRFANNGLITPPCGVPRSRWTRFPSANIAGAFSQRSI
jgi:hypothetical protein